MNIDAVADAYWRLVQQDKGAWGTRSIYGPTMRGSLSDVICVNWSAGDATR